MRNFAVLVFAILMLALVPGCETIPQIDQQARVAMIQAIASEPPGDYFIGRRFYKRDYKFWGFVRAPRQPWTESKLVMLNENRRLAPDREEWRIGSDNGYEYKLIGRYSGDTVYEPASNNFYPEFVLQDITLVSTDPAPIFRTPDAKNPYQRIIATPY